MNQKIKDFKWWVGVNSQSDVDRAVFICRVFGIPLFSDAQKDQSINTFERRMRGFHYDALNERTHDPEYIGACQCTDSSPDWEKAGYKIFDDLESLYKFLEELRDE